MCILGGKKERKHKSTDKVKDKSTDKDKKSKKKKSITPTHSITLLDLQGGDS